MRVGVVIPAAGRGERFGPSSKLDQDVGGRAMLLRAVELFTKREEVGAIVVAGPPDRLDEFKGRYGAALSFHGVVIVPGGRAARWETVKLALAAVPADCTHVAVHDAARPAASPRLLDRVFEAARSYDAVVPALPVAATVKRVAPGTLGVADRADEALADAILGDAGRQRIEVRRVLETVDRSDLVEVQTPQVFEAALLRRAYAQADAAGATDDAMLVERLGAPVHAVAGDPCNIKVTAPDDLRLLRAILGVAAPAERPAHMRF